MLKLFKFEDVYVYKMGRSIGRYVPYYVHSFLIGDTLIDSGTAYARKEFCSALDGKNIRQLINTHAHEDHTGNNSDIQNKSGAEILAHRDSLQYITSPEEMKLKLYQKMVWKLPEGSIANEIDKSVKTGSYCFNVIETRGHCDGHICLYEPERKWLFTGDMFCGIKNIYLRSGENYSEILQSMERLAQLDVDTIFCSLKGVVQNGNDVLRQKIQFMNNLIQTARSLYRSGMTPGQIKLKLLGSEDAIYFITAGDFSKKNTIRSILGNTDSIIPVYSNYLY